MNSFNFTPKNANAKCIASKFICNRRTHCQSFAISARRSMLCLRGSVFMLMMRNKYRIISAEAGGGGWGSSVRGPVRVHSGIKIKAKISQIGREKAKSSKIFKSQKRKDCIFTSKGETIAKLCFKKHKIAKFLMF